MSSSLPVKIAIDPAFASQLEPRLSVPHEILSCDSQPDDAMRVLLADTDVFVSGTFKPGWRLDRTNRPLLVHSTGAGVDGISLRSLPRGSTLCNVYGHEHGVAERAFMHMLALQQELIPQDRALRRGDWTPIPAYVPELRQKNLLIIGLGHIGRELVRWGRFFAMNISVVTRTASPERARQHGLASLGTLGELRAYLPAADFVVIAIPSAEGTLDLIDRPELKLMKPTAFIVNVGRGPVINEEALYEALRDRAIAGAGLDVWYRYPAVPDEICLPATQPFHELDNVIMSPHKPTVETMTYRWGEIAANIARHAAGEPLLNVVWRHPEAT